MHYNYHRYYDSGLGRYLRADPIGLDGGINLFAYVQNDPVNAVDPWGEVKWTGSSFQVSAIADVGATFIRYKLTSDCVNNKKAVITVWATGPSIGIGVKAGVTFGTATFEDYDTNINPNNFNGLFMTGSGGITGHPGLPIRPPGTSILPGKGPGAGLSVSYVRLGSAFSRLTDNPGIVYGFDRSLSGTIGTSTVMNQQIIECGCPNER